MAPKAKPKLSATAAVSVEDLFMTLDRHIQRSEYDRAVKVADQVLSVAPGDEDAIQCKIVALIKADNIDAALSTIVASSNKFPLDFGFFKAYCLFEQNKLDEAMESLKGLEKDSATMLLESQILFQQGKMDASVDIYQKLQKSKIESLEVNLVAGLVAAGRAYEVQGMMDAMRVKATSTFALAYNVACALVERNKYSDAEQLLLLARRIGLETLMDEDLADDEIEIMLAPIAVQLAYVQQLFGNKQEAIESYTDLIKRNLHDESSNAVAINNLIALKGPKDISDGLRKLDSLIEKSIGDQSFQLIPVLELKLSAKQKEAIYINRMLLLLHSNKIDQARVLADALPRMFPNSVTPILLQAAVFVRENKAGKAEEMLGKYAEKFPSNKSKIVLLARAQIAAAAGHPQIASESLLKIPDIQHMPATVATLVSLKERAGDVDGASAVLDSAVKYWSNAMTEESKLSVIMQEAAAFKLKHGQKEEASKLFEELVKSHHSIEALVGLIQTAACTDVEKAETYEKQLKPLPGLKYVDANALEKTPGAKRVENGPQLGNAEPHETKGKEKAKKKRKRKPRYPKGFDPANPGPAPDPERWLPKRERSSFRPKRKDKRAAQIRGSQGAVAKEAANTGNTKSSQPSIAKGSSSSAAAVQPKPSSKSSRKKSRH